MNKLIPVTIVIVAGMLSIGAPKAEQAVNKENTASEPYILMITNGNNISSTEFSSLSSCEEAGKRMAKKHYEKSLSIAAGGGRYRVSFSRECIPK